MLPDSTPVTVLIPKDGSLVLLVVEEHDLETKDEDALNDLPKSDANLVAVSCLRECVEVSFSVDADIVVGNRNNFRKVSPETL